MPFYSIIVERSGRALIEVPDIVCEVMGNLDIVGIPGQQIAFDDAVLFLLRLVDLFLVILAALFKFLKEQNQEL